MAPPEDGTRARLAFSSSSSASALATYLILALLLGVGAPWFVLFSPYRDPTQHAMEVLERASADTHMQALRFRARNDRKGNDNKAEKEEGDLHNATLLSNTRNGNPRDERVDPRPPRRQVTVFYHTFANPNQTPPAKHNPNKFGARSVLSKQQTMDIVLEQVRQVGEAAQESNRQSLGVIYDWILRYTSVGEAGVVDPKPIHAVCQDYPHLTCQFDGHMMEGHEEVTLQRLHQHCLANDNDIVAYIHTKGTFHAHEANHKWRRMLTRGALHTSCLEVLREDQCNVCGLQFYPLWITMFPGNAWSATCSYVRHLLPVTEHAAQMDALVQHVRGRGRSQWTFDVYQWHKDKSGAGRYSKEAWVASHPKVRPCDLLNLSDLAHFHEPESDVWQQLDQNRALPAPRVAADQGAWFRLKSHALQRHMATARVDTSPHEYFLLPGQLYRYAQLYHTFPPHNSWVWTWYPQGTQWRDKLERVMAGNNTLDASILF